MLIYALCGGVIYLNIGHKWGRLSWKAWHKKKRSVAGLLCFPLSYDENKIGDSKAPISTFTDKDEYEKLMAIFWPFKMVFNLLAILSFVFKIVSKTAFEIAINPIKYMFGKRTMKELPPAPEPIPDQFDVDERNDLLEKRARINARLKEIDAHPDKDRVLAQPRRF